MDIIWKLTTVLCLFSIDVFCVPDALPECSGGVCDRKDESSNSRGTEINCATKCPCAKKTHSTVSLKECKKCPCTTPSPDSTTSKQKTTRTMTTILRTTGKPDITTTPVRSTLTTNGSSTEKSTSSIPRPTGSHMNVNNPFTGDNAANNDTDRIFSKDFVIGMIVGATAVGIVVIATFITCYVCYTRNQRMRREIIERYEKGKGLAMIGNEAYMGTSLHRGFLSASASTLRTSVPPDARYAEVEDDSSDNGKRVSHCSLPEVMDKVVDPTSGYAFYKSDRPSVYSGFHGNNGRARNTHFGIHRIDRPTLYTGLKRDNRQRENVVDPVYAEAKEVLPERVIGNNNDKKDTSHTYTKIDDAEQNHDPSTADESLLNVPKSDSNKTTGRPDNVSPFYYQVNKDTDKHHYQSLKTDEVDKGFNKCTEPSEYQSLGEDLLSPTKDKEDNRLPTYFTIEN